MSAQVFEIPDQHATVLEVATAAKARGMHLIHNGREIVVSPVVLPGWREVIVKVKPSAVRLWDEPVGAAA
jgi:hypothetical protein